MAMQACDPLSHAIATSRAAARSPDLPDGGCRAIMLGSSTEVSPSRAGPEGLSPNEDGTSPSRGGDSRPIGLTPLNPGKCHVLGLGKPESARPNEISKESFRAPSSLLKTVLVRAKDPDLSSAEERYCPLLMLNLSPYSSCLDRIPHLEELFGQGGMDELKSQVLEGSDSVGSQGISLTPLKILLPSSSRRSLCWELVAVEERDVQQREDGEKEDTRGEEFIVEETNSWEESCLARFSKFLGFSTSRHEEEILGFMKRFNVGRQKGKGKGGDRTTKFDREIKKLAWNVTDTARKKDGAPRKGVKAYYYGR